MKSVTDDGGSQGTAVEGEGLCRGFLSYYYDILSVWVQIPQEDSAFNSFGEISRNRIIQ